MRIQPAAQITLQPENVELIARLKSADLRMGGSARPSGRYVLFEAVGREEDRVLVTAGPAFAFFVRAYERAVNFYTSHGGSPDDSVRAGIYTLSLGEAWFLSSRRGGAHENETNTYDELFHDSALTRLSKPTQTYSEAVFKRIFREFDFPSSRRFCRF